MKSEKTNYFFDVHLHTFNLSHAGILSFLNRFFLENTLNFNDLLNGNIVEIIMKVIFKKRPKRKFFSICLWIVRYMLFIILILLSPLLIFLFLFKSLVLQKKKLSRSISNTINVLSIFENDLGRQFRYLELDFVSLIPEIKTIIDNFSRQKENISKNALDFYDLVKKAFDKHNNAFPINNQQYHKAIITPLIMDFSYKGFEQLDRDKVYYNLPPRKSVIDQCVDLFEGIKEYLAISKLGILEIYPFLGINPANYDIEPYRALAGNFNTQAIEGLSNHFYFIRHTRSLVHFRAFTDNDSMIKDELAGILYKDPVATGLLENKDDAAHIMELIAQSDQLYQQGRQNDEVRLIKDDGLFKQNMLIKMLLKYFGDYEHPDMETFRRNNPFFTDQEHTRPPSSFWSVRSFFFSGIKVYPPLGFHPWPEKDQTAFIITNFLYQFCEEKGIPITTHCSDGGFKVVAEDIEMDKDIASPYIWEKALQVYNGLILNFAHFGHQGSYAKKTWGNWTDKIISLILDPSYKHVYADISDIGVAVGRYRKLIQRIEWYWTKNKEDLANREIDFSNFCVILEDHILFGTDFMMNLFHSKSNLEYLQIFDRSDAFHILKPEKYVFDKNKLCGENPRRFLFN